ncbi:MAG: NHL repeat-containing protein [Phycisphaerales bacterium]|nr:NHL repeat-containing protein [Phycisphaerales bacterium]
MHTINKHITIFLSILMSLIGCQKNTTSSYSNPKNGMIVAGGNGSGTALNQITPSSVFVDARGNIFVADNPNNGLQSSGRILKFPSNSTTATDGIIVAGDNGAGSALNQISPNAVFIDGAGNIFVSDPTNNRVLKFPSNSTTATDGIIVAGDNGAGSALNQISPNAVFIDGAGNIFVSDPTNNRVLKFPSNSTTATDGIIVAGGNGAGSALNQLTDPVSVFVTVDGTIFILDQDSKGVSRVLKFPSNTSETTNGTIVAGGNGAGNGLNQLYDATSLFVDNNGNIFVADNGNSRVIKFLQNNNTGIVVAGGNGFGSNLNQFKFLASIFIDQNSNIFVADRDNNRIVQFTSTP